jgi:hypothetical protein
MGRRSKSTLKRGSEMKFVSNPLLTSSTRFKKISNGLRKMYFLVMNDKEGLWVRDKRGRLKIQKAIT